MAENYNKNSHDYKMPKLKDLVKGTGFDEIPKRYLVQKQVMQKKVARNQLI